MPALTTSRTDIFDDVRTALRSAGFSRLGADSGIMLVVGPVIDQVYTTQQKAQFVYDQTRFDTATGTYLDRIGNMLGVARGTPARAYTNNFRFYTYDGRAYSQVKTEAMPDRLIIPAGTLVYSPRGAALKFRTMTPVVFESATTEQFCRVEASDLGSAYRVESNTLTGHNHAASASVVWCMNPTPIDSGEDYETDGNYRFRIGNHVQSLGGATAAGLRIRLLDVPGVRDVAVSSNSKGPGTLTVDVLTTVSPTSPEVLERVQDVARDYAAAGIAIEVRAPRDVQVAVRMVAEPDSEPLRQAIRSEVARVVANLGIDQSLQISDLIQAAYLAGADDADVLEIYVEGRTIQGVYNQTPPVGTRFSLASIEVEPR